MLKVYTVHVKMRDGYWQPLTPTTNRHEAETTAHDRQHRGQPVRLDCDGQQIPLPTTTTITLPWTKPPLTANQRHHWAQKARITKTIRTTTTWLAKAKHLPKNTPHATIQLTYTPRDRRRRDADNLVPTLKAICDGLVDYGLTPDDTPNYMTKNMPTITPPDHTHPRLTLTITTT